MAMDKSVSISVIKTTKIVHVIYVVMTDEKFIAGEWNVLIKAMLQMPFKFMMAPCDLMKWT